MRENGEFKAVKGRGKDEGKCRSVRGKTGSRYKTDTVKKKHTSLRLFCHIE